MKITPQQIVDELEIAPGDTLFIKASMNYLGYGPTQTLALLETILDRIGPRGTLLMPSFPFANNMAHPAPGFVFDVKNSPSGLGLLPEMFRRLEGTVRSEQYCVPVSARGLHAEAIVKNQRSILNPYGELSSLRRMIDYQVKMVGLGVTTNYNILAHVADAVLAPRYPFAIFEPEPLHGVLIDATGEHWKTSTVIVSQARRKLMKPSLMIQASEQLKSALRHQIHDGTIIFSVPGPLYFEESLRIGEENLNKGLLPPWLVEMR